MLAAQILKLRTKKDIHLSWLAAKFKHGAVVEVLKSYGAKYEELPSDLFGSPEKHVLSDSEPSGKDKLPSAEEITLGSSVRKQPISAALPNITTEYRAKMQEMPRDLTTESSKAREEDEYTPFQTAPKPPS